MSFLEATTKEVNISWALLRLSLGFLCVIRERFPLPQRLAGVDQFVVAVVGVVRSAAREDEAANMKVSETKVILR